jgi:sensor histidine kinase regulating citrate/malate metabolism
MKNIKNGQKHKLTFEQRIYLIQIGGIVLSILICAITTLSINISSQAEIITQNLMTTAEALAASPTVIETLKLGRTNEKCETFITELIEDMPIVDRVSLVDTTGLIIYHSVPQNIGVYITDQELEFLEYETNYLDTKVDSLNERFRVAHTAVTDTDGTVIGFIAVSMRYNRQFNFIKKFIPAYIASTLILVGAGTLFASTSLKSIRRQLKGYDPEQFSDIYDGNAKVLNIIDEGVIAINIEKRITILNSMGRELLGLSPASYEMMPIQDVMPETKLTTVLETRQAIYNEHMAIHGKNLFITYLPLYSSGQLIGAAALFQEAKLMNEMTEQLEDANNLVDTLRAFNHEFMNKLHVILGYLETDHITEAKEYLLQSSMGSSRSISQISRRITHQGVAAIVIGKAIRASELNITLNLVPESYCIQLTAGIPSNVYVTIIGNLLQNAIEELNSDEHVLKEIQLTVFIDPDSTYISILDTGHGMSSQLIAHVTERGVSSKGPGHGTGLFLVNNLVKEYNGTLKIDSEPDEGTEVTVMMQKK